MNRDGRPDVTIANGAAHDRCNTNGLTIASGGNRIHGLVLSGFGIGVRLAPPFQRGALPRGRTFADIEVSGLVIDACAIGTWLAPTGYRNCERRACATGNRWTDIRITGNRIATRTSGIEFQLGGTKDELLDRVTISGNTVHIRASGRAADTLWGVNLVAGAEAGTNNRIANVVIRGNTVTGNPGGGVRAAAGDNGPDANVVERIRIVGNTVRIGPPESVPRRGGVTRVGVWLTAGDGSRPGEYPERNVVRDVEVRGNKLSEGMGVVAFAACCGASANMITDLRIIGNSIRTLGSRRGIQLTAGHWEEGQPTKANRVHRVTVSRNRIVVGSAGVGVFVGGGSGRLAHGNRVTCVRLSGNRVTGTARPVAVVDNFVEPGGGGPATRNSASLTGC